MSELKKLSIKEILEDPKRLNYDDCNSFYDWFCDESALKNRALALLPKIKFLVSEGILDPVNSYVWFKNNCPMNGSLYDDFRISCLDGGRYIGGFCPRTGYYSVENKCDIWFYEKEDFTTMEFADWSTFQTKIKTDQDFKSRLIDAFKAE